MAAAASSRILAGTLLVPSKLLTRLFFAGSLCVLSPPASIAAERRDVSSTMTWMVQLAKDSYQQGRREEAMGYLRKALLVQADDEEARALLRQYTAEDLRLALPPKDRREALIERAVAAASTQLARRSPSAKSRKIVPPKIAPPKPPTGARPQPAIPPLYAVIDGRTTVTLRQPVRREEGVLMIPMREAAEAMGYLVTPLGDSAMELVSPEGRTRRVQLAPDQTLGRMSLEGFSRCFHVDARYEEAEHTLHLSRNPGDARPPVQVPLPLELPCGP